jgi:hypothetical protein
MEVKLPLYPVINKNTGETKELEMSIFHWGKWKEDNFKDGWDRDWSQGCASPGETGDWRNKLVSKHPGWNDILHKSSKSAGSKTQISKI